MGRDWKKRIGCILLAVMLTVSNVQPVYATAVEDDGTGLCDHHMVHENCGYVEGEENSCTFDCTLCIAEEKTITDQAAVDAVSMQIAALSTVDAVKEMTQEAQLAAYEQTQTAYTAYNALTEEQKTLLPPVDEIFYSLFSYFNSLITYAGTDIVTSGTCGDNINWAWDDSGTLTISGTGDMTDYSVSSDAPWKYGYYIKRIVICEGVTSIGNDAFKQNSNLEEIVIANSVARIGEFAFTACSKLAAITIPTSITSIGEYAFNQCSALTDVYYNGTAEQWAMITIGRYNSKLTEAIIHYAQTELSIVDSGFCGGEGDGRNLTWTLYNDGTFTITGKGAMYNYKTSDKILWHDYKSSIKTLSIGNDVTSIGDYAFSGCNMIEGELSFPDGMTYIGRYAFENCTSVSAIRTFGAHLEEIEVQAFYNCGGITGSLPLPDSLRSIGSNAFLKCEKLTGSLVLPDSLTYVGSTAFSECTGLDGELILGNSLQTIAYAAFRNCAFSNDSLYIPASTTDIHRYAFPACFESLYFRGNAPADNDDFEGFPISANENATIYYLPGTSGWTDGEYYDADAETWYGYQLKEWTVGQSNLIFYPENGATEVGTVSASGEKVGIDKLTITFDKKIKKNSANDSRALLDFSAGTIAIYRKDDDTLVWKAEEDTFTSGTAGTEVCVDSAQTTLVIEPINRNNMFDFDTEYYVIVDAGVISFEDASKIQSISKEEWSFTTLEDATCSIEELTEVDYLAFSAIAYLPFRNPSSKNEYATIKKLLTDMDEWLQNWDEEKGITYSELCAHISQWKLIKVIDNNIFNGFFAAAFQNDNGEVVIAYRGSDDIKKALFWEKHADYNSWADWALNDFQMELFDTVSKKNQYKDAFTMYEVVSTMVGSNQIVVTGHSLGGGLADIVSARYGCKAESMNAISLLDVIYYYDPKEMGKTFKGVDRWNIRDHSNQYDVLAGRFESILGEEIKPYVAHESNVEVDIGKLNMLGNILSGIHPELAWAQFKKFVGQVVSCHGLESLVTSANDGTVIFNDEVYYFTPTKPISQKLTGETRAVDFGSSSNNLFNNGILKSIARTSYGGTGDDMIITGILSDSIIGGPGTDTCDGSFGGDNYYYNKGDGLDIITDIDGEDMLHVLGYNETDVVDCVQNGKYVDIQVNGSTIVRILRERSDKSDKFHICKWTDDRGSSKEITSMLNPKKLKGRLVIGCPVSVQIIDDATGEVVHTQMNDGSDVGAAYTDYGFFYVYQDESGEYVKVADLFEGYSLRIVGEDEGTMDVSVYEVTEDGLAEPVSLADVPVTDTLSATIEKKNDGKLYLILDSDGDDETDEEIPFDGDSGDDDTPGGDSSDEDTSDDETTDIDDVLAQLSGMTAQNVVPGDKIKILSILGSIEVLLAEEELTDEQRQLLAEAKETGEMLLDAIATLETAAKNVSDQITGLPATVEPDDEDAVAKIMAAKKAYDELDTRAKALISAETKAKLDGLVKAATDYKIIKGNNGKWWKNSSRTLSFTVNAPFSKFESVEIDGKTIAESNYTAKSGSTIITLKNSYLHTLSTGEHTITVVFTDNEASGIFTVQKATSSPFTGDTFHLTLWISIMVVAGVTLAVLLYRKRKQK